MVSAQNGHCFVLKLVSAIEYISEIQRELEKEIFHPPLHSFESIKQDSSLTPERTFTPELAAVLSEAGGEVEGQAISNKQLS
jgi:hypothetical protein